MSYDFESWEIDFEFIEREDWHGLVRYRQRMANQNPDSYYDLWRLGDAYIRNGEYQKAIDYLGKLHLRFPDGPDIQHSLLDTLYADGKTENDFNWVVRLHFWSKQQGTVYLFQPKQC